MPISSNVSLISLPSYSPEFNVMDTQCFDGKADGIDDLGRSKAIVRLNTEQCDTVQLFSRVDN